MTVYSWPCSLSTAKNSAKEAIQAGWKYVHIAHCITGNYKGMYLVIGTRPENTK